MAVGGEAKFRDGRRGEVEKAGGSGKAQERLDGVGNVVV